MLATIQFKLLCLTEAYRQQFCLARPAASSSHGSTTDAKAALHTPAVAVPTASRISLHLTLLVTHHPARHSADHTPTLSVYAASHAPAVQQGTSAPLAGKLPGAQAPAGQRQRQQEHTHATYITQMYDSTMEFAPHRTSHSNCTSTWLHSFTEIKLRTRRWSTERVLTY